MSEHFQSVVDHVMGDDDSELGKAHAERDYALHCLEREIAIAHAAEARCDALVKALADIWKIVHTPSKATSHRSAQDHFIADFDNIRKVIKQSGAPVGKLAHD